MLDQIKGIIEKIGVNSFQYTNGRTGYQEYEHFTYEGNHEGETVKLRISDKKQGMFAWGNISFEVKRDGGWVQLMEKSVCKGHEYCADGATNKLVDELFPMMKKEKEIIKQNLITKFSK